MSKPSVFVTRLIPEAGLNKLRQACEVDLWEDELPPSRDALLTRARGKDGVLSLLTDRIDATFLDHVGDQLKVVSNYAVGYDNIDIAELTRRGIPVGNTPGVLTDTTADFAFTLLLAAARRIVEADRYVRDGNWKTWGPRLLMGPDVSGATLGLIGFGRIGKEMARRASGFRMRIIYYSPAEQDDAVAQELGAQSVDLETLLTTSDFVSLHVPLSDETRHMINASTLKQMKPTAILINTARGPIVDTDALYASLRAGQIAHAALDVTDPEPIPPDHPLLQLHNLTIAPHIASASIATRNKMAEMAAENLLAGVRGERLPHCVNPQVYES